MTHVVLEEAPRQGKVTSFLESKVLPVGFIVFLTGLLWLPSRGAHINQMYLWLLIPGLVILLSRGKRLAQDVREMPAIAWAAVLFLGWYSITSLWAHGEFTPGDLLKDFIYINVLLFTTAFYTKRHSAAMLRILDIAAIVAAIATATGLAHYYLLGDVELVYRSHRIRDIGLGEFGDFRNPILAGIFYGTFAAWLFGRLCFRQWNFQSMVMLLGLLSLQTYIFVTYSRTVWVGVSVVFTAALLLARNKRSVLVFAIAAIHFGLMIALVSGAISLEMDEPASTTTVVAPKTTGPQAAVENKQLTQEKSSNNSKPAKAPPVSPAVPGEAPVPVLDIDFSEIKDLAKKEQRRGLTFREQIWRGAWDKIKAKPILGHGAGATFEVPFYTSGGVKIAAYHAHNIYIQFFYDSGIIGIFFLMSMIFCLALVVFKHRSDQYIAQVAMLLVFALAVFGADVDNFVTGAKQYWILFWLPLGLLIGRLYSLRKEL